MREYANFFDTPMEPGVVGGPVSQNPDPGAAGKS